MKHRLLTFTLTIALLACTLCSAALSEALPWEQNSLDGLSLQRSLVRAYGDGYEYFTYSPTSFDVAGRMSSMGIDLDDDGVVEQLSVTLNEDQTVYLNVFDQYTQGEWQNTASVPLYAASLTCNIQANDVFVIENGGLPIIACETWTQENGVADGAAWRLQTFIYDGTGLVFGLNLWLDGTDISGDISEWRHDPDLIAYRPELKDIAADVSTLDLNISRLYWGNMICEQDPSLDVLCRMYSVQDIPYETIYKFTGAGGSKLAGFRSMIVDCGPHRYRLPLACYLSSNTPVAYEEPDFAFGIGTALDENDSGADSEYVIPDSNIRSLTAEELRAYDKDTLALIRNEILARYGYPFQKQKYRDYFGSKSWYHRNESFTYGMLSSLEMENIELIKKLEAK